MPHKRSRRNKTPKFDCPYCEHRLWRVGSRKYYLFCQGKLEIKNHLGISAKKASFLVSQQDAYVTRNTWIEEFYCQKDGKMWMLVSDNSGVLSAVPAVDKHWSRTSHTINPDLPNPSVSEYSYRMSRGAGQRTFN